MWLLVLYASVIRFTLAATGESQPGEQTVVFPRLLESRGVNGEKVLVINDKLKLELTPSTVFSDDVTVYTTENGHPVQYYHRASDFEADLYHDQANMASVTVNERNGIEVEGLIGRSIRIKPAPHMERSMEGHRAHILYTVKERAAHGRVVSNSKPQSQLREDNADLEPLETPIIRERAGQSLTVEVHLVVEKYFSRVYRYDKTKLMTYIARFCNAANLRFATLRSYRVKMKIGAVSIHKTKKGYMKKVRDRKDKFFVEPTLEAFMEQYSKTQKYKKADVFFMMTRLDATHGSEKFYSSQMSGWSYVGGACSYKVGVSEDEPKTYDGVHAFVHEIMHLLGSVHDGEEPYEWISGNTGAKWCSSAKGYIMSDQDLENSKTHYIFSQCTERQLQDFINTPDRKGACLFEESYTRISSKLTSNELPGFDVSLENYCRMLHDQYANVTYVPEDERLRKCRFRCSTKLDFRNRSVTFDHYAVDGMPCGGRGSSTRTSRNQLVCVLGECKYWRPE